MLVPALLFTTLLQAPATPHHHREPAQTEAAKPKSPATPAELTQLLEADLHGADFHGDVITSTIQGDAITLSGSVHSAEHKGLATRVARKTAIKAGWKSVHVLNRVEVELPH